MTNHWIDYQHSDVIMAIGVNTAENHPMSMRWIDRARERGAKLISIDPRLTRTAAVADIWLPLRPGTDIALLGGLINYTFTNKLYQREYILNYTNASYILDPSYSFADGVFSGLADDTYNRDTWKYDLDRDGNPRKDLTLENPRCVFQVMKAHYARYDADTVCNIVGCNLQDFQLVAKTFCATGAPDKAGNILYAMGITQSTHGSQNVRGTAVLQLLLGNIGIPGGGVNAQRGEANVQGSTDMAMLFHILPGYLNMPQAMTHPTLADYNAKETPASSYWSNKPKFLVSLLKAWWGKMATGDNEFCYNWIPKLDGKNRSHIAIFESMAKGQIQGMFVWGQNPAVGGPQAELERKALENLDWMVAVDLFETETASFWRRPKVDSETIKTEVFLLPAAASYEKDGSVSNSGRWIQWRHKAVQPPEDAKSDLWIADQLYKAIRYHYSLGGVFPDPILGLNWDYGQGEEEPDIEKVALEINGYETGSLKPLENFTKLADDGSTACGCWIYSGYYNDLEVPPTKRRIREQKGIGIHAEWAFAWPLNRRILYNRCASDPAGKPWNPKTPLIYWEGGEWQLKDVPDFAWKDTPPEKTAQSPFIMLPELQARLFSPGMADGPFPEHYEPAESPVRNALSPQQNNPAITWWQGLGELASKEEFPYIGTTYRVSEHWQSGIMTRNSPWLGEMAPEMFVEISVELGEKLGISNSSQVLVSTRRGEIKAVAYVTRRLKPMMVGNKLVEIVGMPWHWGYRGLFPGDSANVLTPHVGDPNTTIPEYKAFLCNIRRA
jgi:formate dehydrogenase major subunit